MHKVLVGSIVLSFTAYTGAVSAQTDVTPSTASSHEHGNHEIEALYAEGQREMAPRWRGLHKTGSEAIFVHAKLKKAEKDYLAVWTDHELISPEYFEKEKPYLSARSRVLIDCTTAKTGISDWSYYAGRFGTGTMVGKNKTESVEMSETEPDSMEEQLVQIACTRKPRLPNKRKAKKES